MEDGREIRLDHEAIAQARLVVQMTDLREDLKRSERPPERAGRWG